MSLFVHSVALMDTVVAFRVPLGDVSRADCADAVERAVGWFRHVEAQCSRFLPTSEVSRLAHSGGAATPVSEVVFESVRFALALAHESGGAFDPTVGMAMESRGFNVEYRTGGTSHTAIAAEPTSYRDVILDEEARTITLSKPLLLDLNAVVKGLAVDLAARELRPLGNYLIDAGGDVFAAGYNERGSPWRVGIRHPFDADALIDTVEITDAAVCTSGSYQRRGHILDPRSGLPVDEVASVTVIALTTLVADGLSTAACVLGPHEGVALLRRHGVRGFIVTPTLERFDA